MPKMSSKEASTPWTVGYTTRQKWSFKAAKKPKMSSHSSRNLKPWFSLIGIYRNFRPSKCSQEAVSRPSKIRIFRPTKCKKWGHKKLGTLKPLVLRLSRNRILKSPKCRQRARTNFTLGRNSIFRPPKCIKWATWKYVPLNRRFHDSPKIEIIRLPKCRKWARECHVPMNRGFFDPPKIAPCVSWLCRNRFFRTPKCRKWTHTNECSEPYPMALGIFWSSYVTVISCCVKLCSYVLL